METRKTVVLTIALDAQERNDLMDFLRDGIAHTGREADQAIEPYADILNRQRMLAARVLEALK